MKKLLMFMSILMIGSQIRPFQEIDNKAVTATVITFGAVAGCASTQGRFGDAAIIGMVGATFATAANAFENPTSENITLAVAACIGSYIAARLIK